MRFCFVCPRFHLVPYGGIDSSTVTYARALALAGHEVHAVTTKVSPAGNEVWNGIQIHHRPLSHLSGFSRLFPGLNESFQLARSLQALNRSHSFDLIEIPNWEGIGAFSTMSWLPIVVRHHTSTFDSISAQDAQLTWTLRCLVTLEKAAGFWASANIVHSHYHALKLKSVLDPSSCVQIPHVIPGDCLAVKPDPGLTPFILSVGTLMPRKGSFTLMDAASEFLLALPEWELRLGGLDPNGMHQAYVHKHFSKSIADRIYFEGYVSESRLSELYANCEIYVTTSLFESFGLTLLEAMRRGKPVVASNAGALPELVVDQRTGFLFEPGNAQQAATRIVELAQNPKIRNSMGDRALLIARQHSDIGSLCANYESLARRLSAHQRVL